MKFGKIEDPKHIDFTMPADLPANKILLQKNKRNGEANVYVGCPSWNRADLKNFYPKGTRDELTYYASRFNCIEMNATFYSNFTPHIIEGWHNRTPDEFRFFPKVHQSVSHFKRLHDAKSVTNLYLDGIAHLQEKLGMLFLQLPDNFSPANFETLKNYLKEWPSGFPLAIELRHSGWFDGSWNTEPLYEVLEKYNITQLITDTPGRRDVLHMRLSTSSVFVRFNSINTDADYARLDNWIKRLKLWIENGLENIYFFVHQDLEKPMPLLSGYFIKKLNEELGTNLKIPIVQSTNSQMELF